eukprot:3479-Heterococcus_DN1.PRE.1
MQQAGLTPDVVTYGTLIDTMQKADQITVADELYRRLINAKLITHWLSGEMYTLDFHDYNTGLTLAAMRLVLHNMVAAATNNTLALHADIQMHDAKRDLRIITGHAMNRINTSGSTLQPCITDMLQQLSISCHVDPNNKGKLIVPSKQLLAYCKRHDQTASAAHTA